MPGYSLHFVGSVPRACVCPLCRLPMRDAVKINSCNHKYCDSCLQDFLSKGVFVCPKDQSSLEDTQVVADEKVDETVRSCRVSCLLVKDGCRWAGNLRDLERHQTECAFSKVSCPRHCGVVVARRAVENHMSLVCPKRKVVCDTCSHEFTGDAYQTHSLSCRRGAGLQWCENKCGMRVAASERRHHETTLCPRRPQACAQCRRLFTADTLRAHEKDCDEAKRMGSACSFREYGCSFEASDGGDLGAHSRSACADHLALLLRVVAAQSAELAALRAQLKGVARPTNGCYVWRIDEFARRFTEAQERRQRGDPQLELLSEAFYTGAPVGYKLQVSLFLDGNGPGAGHFLSVYVRLLPGDFDQLLPWPFAQPVTFAVLDQNPGAGSPASCEATFTPTLAWWARQKQSSSDGAEDWQPDEKENAVPLGFGFPKFMSHAQLFEVGGRFVRRDKLFLQVMVDADATDAESKSSRFSSI